MTTLPSTEACVFLSQLQAHNDKTWFEAHRDQCQQQLLEPTKLLVELLIHRITQWDPAIEQPARQCIFRLHRDMRFAKDKTPFHTELKAGIVPGGKKNPSAGYYFALTPDGLRYGGGLYRPPPAIVHNIRSHMASQPEKYSRTTGSEAFAQHFKQIKGERAKRLPAQFRDAAHQIATLDHKSWIAMAQLPMEDLVNPAYIDTMVEGFRALHPWLMLLRTAAEH